MSGFLILNGDDPAGPQVAVSVYADFALLMFVANPASMFSSAPVEPSHFIEIIAGCISVVEIKTAVTGGK